MVPALTFAAAAPVTGMRAWYRGDQYVSGTWTDLSGNGYHLTEATNPPTAVSSDSNFAGQPTVDFDGTNDILNGTTISNLIADNAFSIFGVVRAEAFGTQNSDQTAQRGILSNFSGGNSMQVGMGLDSIRASNYDGATDYIGPTASLNTTYGFWFLHDSGNIRFRRSGAAEETPVASGNSGGVADALIVGADYQGDTFLDGQIGGLIIYNTVLSAADILTNESYLTRYGITW